MQYYFKPSALSDLRRLPKNVRQRIFRKIDFYCHTDNPLKFAESLKDAEFGEYRFRIGDYRVIFDLEKDKIIILALGDRKDIYR